MIMCYPHTNACKFSTGLITTSVIATDYFEFVLIEVDILYKLFVLPNCSPDETFTENMSGMFFTQNRAKKMPLLICI